MSEKGNYEKSLKNWFIAGKPGKSLVTKSVVLCTLAGKLNPRQTRNGMLQVSINPKLTCVLSYIQQFQPTQPTEINY